MTRPGLTALASILCLALSTIGCGGDDDGGEALSADDQQDLCDRNCDHRNTCEGTDYDACLDDCLRGAHNFASGPAHDYVDCFTSSCDTNMDQCLLDLDTRGIAQDALDACSDFEARCSIDAQGLCDGTEPEGGALLKLLSDDVLNELIDCFAGSCQSVPNCVSSVIGFF